MSRLQAPTCDRTVREIADRIFNSHRITRADQQVFMASLLSKSALTPEEENLINKVFEELKRGVLRVVD
ncbi:MAG: hypothetical protein J7641_16750 [Cyanobacteria bacterium SID2]|nr:hypothetical protein [Cyanobacteria bacterium SID2]MBP0004910.1 hypothetical protein [Cyanobacteria bacterium SBC]